MPMPIENPTDSLRGTIIVVVVAIEENSQHNHHRRRHQPVQELARGVLQLNHRR